MSLLFIFFVLILFSPEKTLYRIKRLFVDDLEDSLKKFFCNLGSFTLDVKISFYSYIARILLVAYLAFGVFEPDLLVTSLSLVRTSPLVAFPRTLA